MSEFTHPSEEAYEFLVEPHRRAMIKFEMELQFFLQDIGQLSVFSITSRMKNYHSALRKATKLRIAVTDLDDLAGLRIVVGTRAEVPIVERFFTRQEVGNDVKILKHAVVKRSSGYRATHMIVAKNSHYQSSAFPGRIEIQIHTIFEHAFNFLSRVWTYKQAREPTPQWTKSFSRLSRMLAEIDSAAEELYLQLSEVQNGTEQDSLSPYSLKRIIKEEFDEDEPLADCVDACRMYSDLGYRTNSDLRAHFRDNRIFELFDLNQRRCVSATKPGPLGGMSKYVFWGIFGTRIDTPGIKEFFASIPPDI